MLPRLAKCNYVVAKYWKPELGVTARKSCLNARVWDLPSGNAVGSLQRSHTKTHSSVCDSNGPTAERTWRHLLNERKTSLHCLLKHDMEIDMEVLF